MTHDEIRAAFATIANNTKESHTRAFALAQFESMREDWPDLTPELNHWVPPIDREEPDDLPSDPAVRAQAEARQIRH